MRFRDITRLLVVGAIVTSFPARADTLDGAGTCPNDSKLLNGGPTEVFGEGPGTWWGLVTNGLLAAGFVEEADQIAYLNQIFNTSFDNLEDLKAYNLLLVNDTWDETTTDTSALFNCVALGRTFTIRTSTSRFSALPTTKSGRNRRFPAEGTPIKSPNWLRPLFSSARTPSIRSPS